MMNNRTQLKNIFKRMNLGALAFILLGLVLAGCGHLGLKEAPLTRFSEDSRWGYKNTLGKVVILPQFQHAHDFFEDVAAVDVEGKWGYIDKSGKFVIPPQYEVVYDFSEGLAGVRANSQWSFIDHQGNVVIPSQFEHVTNFSEGLACVQFNDTQIYIDQTGKPAFPQSFEDGVSFSEGLAAVRVKEIYWGYIDKTGNFVIQPVYTGASIFSNGVARVILDGKEIYIDKTGAQVEKPQ